MSRITIVAPNVCGSLSTKRLFRIVDHGIIRTIYRHSLELEIMNQFQHNRPPETDNCQSYEEYEYNATIMVLLVYAIIIKVTRITQRLTQIEIVFLMKWQLFEHLIIERITQIQSSFEIVQFQWLFFEHFVQFEFLFAYTLLYNPLVVFDLLLDLHVLELQDGTGTTTFYLSYLYYRFFVLRMV